MVLDIGFLFMQQRHLSLEKQIVRHNKYMEGSANYYVAENDQKELLGFASYGMNRIKDLNCNLELYTIYVKSSEQGNGIGKKLLARILDQLSSTENAIIVSVFDDNPFKSFYLKNGFNKIRDEIIDMGDFKLASSIYERMLR